MKIEKAKAELKAATSGTGGRYWVYTPAVSAVLAALEQAEQRIAELYSRIDPQKPIAWIVHARTGDSLTQDGDYVANAEGVSNISSTPLYAAPPSSSSSNFVDFEIDEVSQIPVSPVPDFKKLAAELVENLVDCDAADDSAIRQYLKWAEKTCRVAMAAAASSKEG